MDPTFDSQLPAPLPQTPSAVQVDAPPVPTLPLAEPSAWQCPRSHAILWITMVVGLASDLLTKHLAFAHLPATKPMVLFPGFLSLDRSLNLGALFGIGKGMSPLFILASVLAVGFVGYMFASSHRRQWVVHLALGLVLAGAMGNLYDRLFVQVDVISRAGQQLCPPGKVTLEQPHEDVIQVGRYPDGGEPRWRFSKSVQVETRSAVRDFIRIDIYWGEISLWPWIFNIADSMLVIGVSLLLIIYWRHPTGPLPRRPTPAN